MARKTGLFYNKDTGKIYTVISVSKGNDLILNKRKGLEILEVDNNHRCISDVEFWYVKNNKIIEKPKIEAEEIRQKRIKDSLPEYTKDDSEILNEILIGHINTLKTKAGIANIDLNTIKAELNQRREQYKNPDKK